nr:DUF3489 domain-containing protein [Luteimonas panaciterrae]
MQSLLQQRKYIVADVDQEAAVDFLQHHNIGRLGSDRVGYRVWIETATVGNTVTNVIAHDLEGPRGKLVRCSRRYRRRKECENYGWQAHTVRGTFAGAFKKKLGLTITSTKDAGGERVYRIAEAGSAP